jgi:hypothetical protein
LRDAGVEAISLEAFESRRRDRWGNEFRYRAKVRLAGDRVRWSYDVFLVYLPAETTETNTGNRATAGVQR